MAEALSPLRSATSPIFMCCPTLPEPLDLKLTLTSSISEWGGAIPKGDLHDSFQLRCEETPGLGGRAADRRLLEPNCGDGGDVVPHLGACAGTNCFAIRFLLQPESDEPGGAPTPQRINRLPDPRPKADRRNPQGLRISVPPCRRFAHQTRGVGHCRGEMLPIL